MKFWGLFKIENLVINSLKRESTKRKSKIENLVINNLKRERESCDHGG